MTAPLHERLAEAAKAADSWPWIPEPREGHHIYTDHCDENGNGIQCPAIGIHPDHRPWKETKDYILLAQPRNVANLCEQVRVMKEALQECSDAIERATQPERIWNAWTPALVEARKSAHRALDGLVEQ